MKSEVEVFWEKISPYFGTTRSWHELHPREQQRVVQGLNLILWVATTDREGG